jgi:hypothetical protein
MESVEMTSLPIKKRGIAAMFGLWLREAYLPLLTGVFFFHSGFNVYCGNAIWPHNEDGLENLARYIIRASFSQERMTYIPANDTSDGVSKEMGSDHG